MRSIIYHFHVSGRVISHAVTLWEKDAPAPPQDVPPPDWATLAFHQCEGCRFSGPYCPVATGLQEPALLLDQLYSFEPVLVEVETPERIYRKHTTVQEGLSSLFGLVMARSGCPAFEPFHGLAWFHLPFASFEETLFRIASSLLLRQYLANQSERDPAYLIQKIKSVYEEIYAVNRGTVRRLKAGAAPLCDSPFNAITLLDSTGALVAISIEEGMEDIRHHFE